MNAKKAKFLLAFLFFFPLKLHAYGFLNVSQSPWPSLQAYAQAETNQVDINLGNQIKSQDQGKEIDLTKYNKPLGYTFPILWDLAPVIAFPSAAYYCSTQGGDEKDIDCMKVLSASSIFITPLWSIVPDVYVKASVVKISASALVEIAVLGTLYGTLLWAEDLGDFAYGFTHMGCGMEDNYLNPECEDGPPEHIPDPYYRFLGISVGVIQLIAIISHIVSVEKNNIYYEEFKAGKTKLLIPYISDRNLGVALHWNF